MKKILLLALMCLTLGNLFSRAETVSQKQAQEMANMFFNEVSGLKMAPPKMVYNGKKLTTSRLFSPFYVYNNPAGGFVIISAENKAYPILGFSLKDSFDPNGLDESLQALLASYAREIELVRYDGEEVPNVEKAWINYPNYVKDILSRKYNATDPKISVEEARELLEASIQMDDETYSDIYTPDQWDDMIREDLQKNEFVPLGIFSNQKIYPAVIYGSQGDFFRIAFNTLNSWLLRLNATENIPGDMVSGLSNAITVNFDEPEEPAFSFLDQINREEREAEELRASQPMTDIQILQSEPVLSPLGGGHYRIDSPVRIERAFVHNLSGAQLLSNKYRESDVVFIDISPEPTGFYIINVIDENGDNHGFKVYR